MDLQSVMNSPGMWIASSFMVLVVLIQSALFLREGFKAAGKIGMQRSDCIKGMRAAMIIRDRSFPGAGGYPFGLAGGIGRAYDLDADERYRRGPDRVGHVGSVPPR